MPTQRLGRRVLVFDQLDSTNSYAAKLAEDLGNDGVAILADRQSNGRGQHGRVWTAPSRASVLLSLLLFPPAQLRRPALLTAWVAVAVCKVIASVLGRTPRIKWPNDVLIDDRKVCGILIEQGRGVVVGIGLNVCQTAADFLGADLPEATSLLLASGVLLDPAEVTRRLLVQLDADYEGMCAGDVASLQSSWRTNLALLNRQVRVETGDGWCQGKLLRLDLESVVVERSCGDHLTLQPERVQHLTEIKVSVLFA